MGQQIEENGKGRKPQAPREARASAPRAPGLSDSSTGGPAGLASGTSAPDGTVPRGAPLILHAFAWPRMAPPKLTTSRTRTNRTDSVSSHMPLAAHAPPRLNHKYSSRSLHCPYCAWMTHSAQGPLSDLGSLTRCVAHLVATGQLSSSRHAIAYSSACPTRRRAVGVLRRRRVILT